MPTHPTSSNPILILCSHLSLRLSSGLFPSGFATKTLYTTLLSPIRATCPVHLILLGLITRIIFGEEYWSLSSSLCSFLHYPVTSSLLGPYILLQKSTRHHTIDDTNFQLLYTFRYFSIYLRYLESLDFKLDFKVWKCYKIYEKIALEGLETVAKKKLNCLQLNTSLYPSVVTDFSEFSSELSLMYC